MTANQTIDGVPRELLERALLDAQRVRFATDKQVIELRALLDAPAQPSEVEALRAAVEKWKGIAGRRTAERTEFMNERDDLKAAQHQGEPVAWMYEHDGMVHNEQFKPLFYVNRQVGVREPWSETALYAEQPPEPKP